MTCIEVMHSNLLRVQLGMSILCTSFWDCQGNWGIPGYLDKGGGGFQYFYCIPSWDRQGNWGIPGYLDKGGGGGFQYFYCTAGVPSWDCQGN